jgi:hypothetical protein
MDWTNAFGPLEHEKKNFADHDDGVNNFDEFLIRNHNFRCETVKIIEDGICICNDYSIDAIIEDEDEVKVKVENVVKLSLVIRFLKKTRSRDVVHFWKEWLSLVVIPYEYQ